MAYHCIPDLLSGDKFDGAILSDVKCGADGKVSGEIYCRAGICPNIPTVKAAKVDIHVQQGTLRHFGDFQL